MATKSALRRKKCREGYEWGEIKSEEKKEKENKEKKPIGGKPKMGCIRIKKGKGVAEDEKWEKEPRS